MSEAVLKHSQGPSARSRPKGSGLRSGWHVL